MGRVEEGNTYVGSSCEGGGGKLILVKSLGIGSSQAAVLEDAQTQDFSNVFKNFWELKFLAEEILAKRFLEIPDVAFCAALLVCLSKALAFLNISSGSKTGVAGGPFGFALVLGLLEATLYQWILQLDDYNRNNVQALSIIKAWIYGVSQGS